LEKPSTCQFFYQGKISRYPYGQVSMELNGFMEKGFVNQASQLAFALGTPFLYLDENNQLLWQAGNEKELREALRWFNIHRRELENSEYLIETSDCENGKKNSLFEIYFIDIAGLTKQKLVASSNLADWQKKMIDKLTGLTALLLQTEGMFQEQQIQFKEHFVYDLLYHKFESQKVMVKQGKSWGWNLEKPHHLLLIDVSISVGTDINWLDEILLHIENHLSHKGEPFIVFPFQDQVVVLLEDGENRTISNRKNFVLNAAIQLEKELSCKCPDDQFQIGIGKWYEDTLFLNKSYQEAKLALRFGKIWLENENVFHINDLGVLRLLIHLHQEILADYSDEYLSQLIESDQENETEYIKTLKAYIQHKGIINEVSDALYIHPNTLRNRIKKIEELTGINLLDPEESINLVIAAKINSLFHSK
jgi:sugar diacid utilization regulator